MPSGSRATAWLPQCYLDAILPFAVCAVCHDGVTATRRSGWAGCDGCAGFVQSSKPPGVDDSADRTCAVTTTARGAGVARPRSWRQAPFRGSP